MAKSKIKIQHKVEKQRKEIAALFRRVPSKWVPIDSIKPHPRNTEYHQHPDAQIDTLSQSGLTFGQYKNVVIWRNLIIAGAGIWAGLKKAGATEIEVKDFSFLTETLAMALMTADNESQKGAVTDERVLAQIVADIAKSDDGGEALAQLAAGEAKALQMLIVQSTPQTGEWSDALGNLPTGDRAPFQQITFTLHDTQAEQVKAALTLAKSKGDFVDSPNENSNGNAIARICETYATQNG